MLIPEKHEVIADFFSTIYYFIESLFNYFYKIDFFKEKQTDLISTKIKNMPKFIVKQTPKNYYTFTAEWYEYDEDGAIADSHTGDNIIDDELLTEKQAKDLFTTLIKEQEEMIFESGGELKEQAYNRMEYYYKDEDDDTIFVEHWDFNFKTGETEREVD